MDYVALEFQHTEDWDTNGVLYWLGTDRGTKLVRRNPAKDLAVRIQMSSSVFPYSGSDIADRGPRARGLLFTTDIHQSWVSIDLGPSISLILTDYTIQHDSAFSGQLRNWRVSGSNGEQSWEVLRHHANDCALPNRQPRASATWHIPSWVWPGACKAYRHFLITQTGPNAGGTHELHCRALELYGTVILHK
jgi:hypothetical protein